jgi:hypothetical protein
VRRRKRDGIGLMIWGMKRERRGMKIGMEMKEGKGILW